MPAMVFSTDLCSPSDRPDDQKWPCSSGSWPSVTHAVCQLTAHRLALTPYCCCQKPLMKGCLELLVLTSFSMSAIFCIVVAMVTVLLWGYCPARSSEVSGRTRVGRSFVLELTCCLTLWDQYQIRLAGPDLNSSRMSNNIWSRRTCEQSWFDIIVIL